MFSSDLNFILFSAVFLNSVRKMNVASMFYYFDIIAVTLIHSCLMIVVFLFSYLCSNSGLPNSNTVS